MEKPFSAYRGKDSYAFVCYAHADDAIVYPEIGWLHRNGLRLCYDEGIPGGRVWSRETAAMIEAASVVLYYLSSSSISSTHCNREIHYAFNLGVPVVPVYIEALDLPSDLALNLSHVQALHRSTPAHRDLLLNALHLALDQERLATSEPDPTLRSVVPRIAVFPFENLVGSTDHDWLGRRLAQKTMQLLHESGHLDVVPERDVKRFVGSDASVAQIGRATGAHYLLEGAILINGEQFTLDVTLTDTNSSRQIWSQTFAGALAEILEVHSALLGQLAGALEVTSSRNSSSIRGTTNSRAYLAFLENPYPITNDVDACLRSIESMKRAIHIDPRYGNAYVSMAASYYFLALARNDPAYMKLAAEHFQTSLDVGGVSIFNAAWSTWCVCTPAISGRFDWPRAESALRDAMSQTDDYVRWLTDPIEEVHAPLERGYAQILRAAGLFQEAAAFADLEVERVRCFHPEGWDRQGIAQVGVPVSYSSAGWLEKCREFIEEDLQRRPEVAENYVRRAEFYHIPAGKLREARTDLDVYWSSADLVKRQLGKDATTQQVEQIMRERSAAAEILLAIAQGDHSTAKNLIETSGHREYLGRLDDMDGLVAYLDETLRSGNRGLFWRTRELLLGTSDPERLSQHDGYRALLRQVNLTDEWQQELSERVELLAPYTGIHATTLAAGN